MNIFLHELKAYRRFTFLWMCSLAAVAVLMLSMFPSFAKDVEPLKQLLHRVPQSILKAVGLQIDLISSILGFYSYIFTYILLCGAIQAMILGISIQSKEVREKTADFLLVKPVSRAQIITSKLMAAVTSLLITNLFYLAVVSFMANRVSQEEYSYRILFLITFTLWIVQLIFFALGFFISVVVPKIKAVLPISLGIVFSFFIMGLFSSAIGDKAIRYITPFKYFEPSYIMQHASYEISFLMISVFLIVGSIVMSYMIYIKKDIHVG